jgi:hypothetical protein
MGSVFKDDNQFQIFMRLSPQGRVVRLLDLFRLNGMNKREKGGIPLSRGAVNNSFTRFQMKNMKNTKRPDIEYNKINYVL